MSDDWLILSKDLAFPYPKRIRIYDYNIISNRFIAKRVFGLKYPLVRLYLKSLNNLKCKFPSKTIRFLLNNYNYFRSVDINTISDCFKEIQPLPVGKIFLLMNSSPREVSECETDPEKLAYFLARVNYYERLYLYREYYKYLINSFYTAEINIQLENRIQRDYKLFREAFENKEIHVLDLSKIDDNALEKILHK